MPNHWLEKTFETTLERTLETMPATIVKRRRGARSQPVPATPACAPSSAARPDGPASPVARPQHTAPHRLRAAIVSLGALLASLLAPPLWAAEPADILVSAGTVVTMNAHREVLHDAAVAVKDGRILAVGARTKLEFLYTPKLRLSRPDAILTPGLINTHAHAAMSLLRGIADDRSLQDWLDHYIFPAEMKNVTFEFVRAGTRLGVLEMMLGGITTYADMYYFENEVARVTRDAGMRGVLGETIIGLPAPDNATPQQALAFTERFIREFRNDALITPAVAPHAPYTTSPESLQAARALADKYSVPLLIHVSETRKENDDSLAQHGLTPAQYLVSIGAVARRTIFAHGVWLTPGDLAALAPLHVGIAHCPSSNMKLASGIAPISAMLAAGLAVGLGTDGPAGSNNDMDLLEELDLAAKLAKVTQGDPRALPAIQAFEIATIGGARALGMDGEIGSLEPGKRADFITLDTTAPHAVPAHDPYSMLVYSLKASDVRDVVIEGGFTVRDHVPMTLDAGAILEDARKWRVRIEASLRDH
jgi:5-methylthioadenosine/S-adenosylhomocysteine deaminase